jgi:hypothetical protein
MPLGVKVESYSGFKVHERPVTFFLGRKKMRVTAIVDQWYGPAHTYFKILAEDANIYILRYSEVNDQWELVFFKDGNYDGEVSPGAGENASS